MKFDSPLLAQNDGTRVWEWGSLGWQWRFITISHSGLYFLPDTGINTKLKLWRCGVGFGDEGDSFGISRGSEPSVIADSTS